jgi:aspartate aminotransferase
MKLSKRTQAVKPSLTLTITSKAKALRKQGIDVIGFGAGEPDFDTPDEIKNEAKKALDAGHTKYTPTAGIPELRQGIVKKLKGDNGLDYKETEILVSCGAKHSCFNIVMALCDAGDELLIPAPYWVSYPEMAHLAEAKPVIIPTTEENRFLMTAKDLEEKITPKSKALFLNSPSNPTGMIYEKKELEEIAQVAIKNNLFVISDEIYEKIIYDGKKHISIASLGEEIKKRTIVINGFSKSYSMTGWRMGYAAGPEEIIRAANRLQDHSTSGANSITQYAGIAALNLNESYIEQMRQTFQKRRDLIVTELNEIPGVTCLKPEGAFYVFPNISGLGKDSLTLADELLEQARVALVPGVAFGSDQHVRLSYATSEENIKEGLKRIKSFVTEKVEVKK